MKRKIRLCIVLIFIIILIISIFNEKDYEDIIFENSTYKTGIDTDIIGEKPSKKNISVNNNKIIMRSDMTYEEKHENSYFEKIDIIQCNDNGYIKYELTRGFGDMQTDEYWEIENGVDSSYKMKKGIDLLRLTGAYYLYEAYLYKDISSIDNSEKYNGITYSPRSYNEIEKMIFNIEGKVNNLVINEENYTTTDRSSVAISSKDGNKGIGVYKIKNGNECTYKLKTTDNQTANLLYLVTPDSSEKIQVLINGRVVKEFNSKERYIDRNLFDIIEFEVPTYNNYNSNEYEVTIKNISLTGNFHISCFNFKNLKEYNNEYVDEFKTIGSDKVGWIENRGANDYAFNIGKIEDGKLTDSKFVGSYHGFEYLLDEKISWNKDKGFYRKNYVNENNKLRDIMIRDWCIIRDFYIDQITNIDNKAIMTSRWDLNVDGTFTMDCNLESIDSQGIETSVFYTGITCTQKKFIELKYPYGQEINKKDKNVHSVIECNTGLVQQYNPTDKMQIDIRFTKFFGDGLSEKSSIVSSNNYLKHYYTPFQTSRYIKQIKFSKSLDFKLESE